jgi:hypothetical protein
MPLRQLTAVCLIAMFVTSSGCGLMPTRTRHRNTRQWSRPLYGVEDLVFHGHHRTWWREWNNEAWKTTQYPPQYDMLDLPEMPPDVPPSPEQLPHHAEFPDAQSADIPTITPSVDAQPNL